MKLPVRFNQLENVQLDITCQMKLAIQRNMFSLKLFLLHVTKNDLENCYLYVGKSTSLYGKTKMFIM